LNAAWARCDFKRVEARAVTVPVTVNVQRDPLKLLTSTAGLRADINTAMARMCDARRAWRVIGGEARGPMFAAFALRGAGGTRWSLS
jgi:hypothetical protein